jgi:lipoprotein-anchoring transpeptidase ErfK/SrfK
MSKPNRTAERQDSTIDYVAILTRAVAALGTNNRETRAAIYERARSTVFNRLSAGGTAMSPAAAKAHVTALEAAIARVEHDSNQKELQSISLAESYERTSDIPPLTGAWRPLRAFSSLALAAIVVVGGIVIYFSLPRIIAELRASLRPVHDEAVMASNVRAAAPYVRLRQIVYYRSNQPVGTIVVDKSQPFLYVVRPNVSALRYSIDLGEDCSRLAGLFHVLWKQISPSVLYLNDDHRIHGVESSNEQRPSTMPACIRLTNDDVDYLYRQTPVDSRVVISN